MSVNRRISKKRLSSKKKKIQVGNAQKEVLFKLGLEAFWTKPLDQAAMLDITTWSLENQPPLVAKYLPRTFLQQLWLLNPKARSPCCQAPPDDFTDIPGDDTFPGLGKDSQCAVNPLDLVTAVYMSANSFLQQEMTLRMVQCQFAVPLLLPPMNPDQQGCFLLWPLRGVVGQWRQYSPAGTSGVLEGDLASTQMPLISCVKLGHCSVSKSHMLNQVMGGPQRPRECFLHRGMDGGQLPHTLSNGLVELCWYLPSGDTSRDVFPQPIAIANLRGDAAAHEKQLSLLCRASSAVVVFCGNIQEKERHLLASWKSVASQIILIDLSDPTEEVEKDGNGVTTENLGGYLLLPEGAVLSGCGISEDELADSLKEALKNLMPEKLSSVTLEAASSVAEELGLSVDEGEVCRKALAQVEEVLWGLEGGAAQYREQQLPLQGAVWKRLAGVEKEKSRQKGAAEDENQQLQTEKQSLLEKLGSYKMTVAMRIFIDALCTADKMERAYFLSWMRLRLEAKQRRQYSLVESEGKIVNGTNNETEEEAVKEAIEEPGKKGDNSFTTGSTEEEVKQEPEEQHLEAEPSFVGLEHFLREMGLIFELTHSSSSSGYNNVLRLPSVATDLLLHGVPLELLDGDASAVPQCWVGCVLAEFNRRLQPEGVRFRVVTTFGVRGARNAEVFSALFGVNFPKGRRRCTRGAYMLALSLPDNLKKDMECDFLLMVDVEGLCPPGMAKQGDTLEHDNEMATLVTGLSDIMLHSMPPDGDTKMQTTLAVTVNALLRARESGAMPICQLLTQGIGLDSKLLSLQLKRVIQILETEADEAPAAPEHKNSTEKVNSSIPCLIGPWQNTSLSLPVDKEYSKAILELKQSLFQALTKCAAKSKATGLPEFTVRLCGVWETVQGETLSIGFRNTEVAEAFCMLCTELSQWEKILTEHLESWFSGAQERIITCKVLALERGDKANPLDVLKEEARTEVKAEVDKIRSRLVEYLKKDDLHKTYIETYKPNLLNYLNTLQEQMIHEVTEKLESATENHYSTTKLKSFQTVLEAKQETKLHSLVESCKINNSVLGDNQLEEDFETVWSDTLSNFDFRPSEKEDITTRVTEVLKKNLTSRGLLKHLKKLDDVRKDNTTYFIVYDEHFGYRSRLKHMFEENNRLQKLEAHRLVSRIIKEYNVFLAEKSAEIADFSDSYIAELLKNIDKALRAKPMEIRSAFEVDLKVYLCSHACCDFQEMHDRYARDRDFLVYLNGTKNRCLGEFVYQFRKRDQCQRVARAFITMVFKPAALDYIYRPLGNCIMEEMVSSDNTQYLSPQAFNRSLLEELMQEDTFESFLEYLLSYNSFSLKRIQDRVVGHITGSAMLEEWRQQRLGEIVGKMAAAVSHTSEGVSGVQSDTKLLLEKVCLVLEADGDVTVSQDPLQGPIFHITTEWDRFVTCLLESLAEMRLALAQEFSQNSVVAEVLQAHPGMPQKSLFNRVRGCGKQCPFCKAPCEAGESDHEVHRALLHRPKGMLSYACTDSSSLSHSTCPSDMARENLFLNKDTGGQSLPYREYYSLYPDWSIPPEDSDSQRHSAYWRYILVRFNSRFAQEYQREPAQLPEEWKKITQEEALESLREALHTEQC